MLRTATNIVVLMVSLLANSPSLATPASSIRKIHADVGDCLLLGIREPLGAITARFILLACPKPDNFMGPDFSLIDVQKGTETVFCSDCYTDGNGVAVSPSGRYIALVGSAPDIPASSLSPGALYIFDRSTRSLRKIADDWSTHVGSDACPASVNDTIRRVVLAGLADNGNVIVYVEYATAANVVCVHMLSISGQK